MAEHSAILCMLKCVVGYSSLIASRSDASENPKSWIMFFWKVLPWAKWRTPSLWCSTGTSAQRTDEVKCCILQSEVFKRWVILCSHMAGLSCNDLIVFSLCCRRQCCLHSRWANLFGTRSLHVRAWQDKESSLRQVNGFQPWIEIEKLGYDKGPVPLAIRGITYPMIPYAIVISKCCTEPQTQWSTELSSIIFEHRLEWQFLKSLSDSGRNWMVCEADSQADEEVRGLATPEIFCAMMQ